MRKILFPLLVVLSMACALFAQGNGPTEGTLFASDKQGPLGFCPLKNTKVRADISGFVARVTVVQEFENSYGDPIEAVYTFPLSQNSAVDDMTMRIGERVIRGRIMKREDARKVYETAKAAGQTAGLLDQQRPNIFTQSVANIMPGEKVIVEISYVETLKYEDGSYEFVFPMVVGPRYNPASMKASDVKAITPPIAQTRAGHDISIEVNLDAGLPIEEVRSISHDIETIPNNADSRKITLKDVNTIPNKDFVLRYDVTGKKIQDAVITHRGPKGGFFTMMLQPPDNFAPKDVSPKEIVFVLDTSGSMSGFPIETAKNAMNLALDGLYPRDTFNLITFAGDTSVLFERPVPATAENLAKAREFLLSRKGYGGTEMMNAIKTALDPSDSQKHVRIVCFMTDGYVGNEAQIIAEIQSHPNARIFSFGIGRAVNRFLLDKMAVEGRGEVEYVSEKDDGPKAAQRFHERVRNPLLTDISVDWGQMGAADVYSGRQADLFSAKPVALTGRFTKAGRTNITLKGKMAGLDYQRDIPVTLPETETANDALATIWARARVDDLMSKYYGTKLEPEKKALEAQITQLGLEFRLMTQFTSFVAVEERVVNQNGRSVKMEVPIYLAEGVNPEAAAGATSGFAGNTSSFAITTVSGLPINGRNVGDLATLTPSAQAASSPGQVGDQRVATRETPASLTVAGPPVLNTILQRMESHRGVLTSLRADIKTSTFNSQLSETKEREGKLIFLPNKGNSSVRINWKDPEDVFSMVNGSYVLYQPILQQQVTGKAGEVKLTNIFVMLNRPKADFAANFNITYVGAERLPSGAGAWHLELKPKAPGGPKSIHLWIDNEGMIIQEKLIEQNDDSITVLLSALEKNVAVQPEDFKIEVPKGIRIVRAGEPESK